MHSPELQIPVSLSPDYSPGKYLAFTAYREALNNSRSERCPSPVPYRRGGLGNSEPSTGSVRQ